MHKFLNVLLLAAVLSGPAIRLATAADVKVYVDAKHHDKHEWNDDEDKRYRAYMDENHRKYVGFDKLKRKDQDAYWEYRHAH